MRPGAAAGAAKAVAGKKIRRAARPVGVQVPPPAPTPVPPRRAGNCDNYDPRSRIARIFDDLAQIEGYRPAVHFFLTELLRDTFGFKGKLTWGKGIWP